MGTDFEIVVRAAGEPFGTNVVEAAGKPFVQLTALGLVVSEHVDKIGFFEPSVEVVEKEVGNDFVRFVLRCREMLGKPVEEVVRGFKTGCFKIAREYGLMKDGMPIFEQGCEVREITKNAC